jgi:hypothetical protein
MTAKGAWVFLTVFFAMVSGFAEEERKEIGLAESIQPRAEGAWWRYRSIVYEDGKVVSSGSSHEKVLEVIEIEGVKCYRVEQGWDYRTVVQRLAGLADEETGARYYWEYWDGNGSNHYDEEEESKPPESLEDFSLTLKYPAVKGTRYVADETIYRILETGKNLKVKAGEYPCVVYEMLTEDKDDPEFSTRELLFMSPGVGLVRWEMYYRDGLGQWALESRDELTSHRLFQKVKAKEPAAKESE